jgi:SAM-dependent methyltransferase
MALPSDRAAGLRPQPPAASSQSSIPSAAVLDVACGSRMFWFDRQNPDAIFCDKRAERHELTDASSKGGTRSLVIAPDIQCDFTDLPFADNTFAIVCFDPPHLVKNGANGWLAKKYGKLGEDWRGDLRKGFAECFRVLRPEGALIFKWNEHDVPVSQVLALATHKPLFGNRGGKAAKSHWLVFMKPASAIEAASAGETRQGLDPKDESPVPQADAQHPSSEDTPS